jgi:hypothetical protein
MVPQENLRKILDSSYDLLLCSRYVSGTSEKGLQEKGGEVLCLYREWLLSVASIFPLTVLNSQIRRKHPETLFTCMYGIIDLDVLGPDGKRPIG